MIIILNDERPAWTSKEAKEFRDFLTSETGVKMLTLATLETPVLLDGAHMNKSLVRGGEHKGFEAALAFITSLVHTEPEQPAPEETYPSLDDDSKWPDGTPKAETKTDN